MSPFVFVLLTVSIVLGGSITNSNTVGTPTPGGRIIGGRDADVADYPYQLGLLEDKMGPICGAILIAQDWALTAAHCTIDLEESKLSVRAGSSYSDKGGQVIPVKKKYEHPDYSFENDITLLKLSLNVTISIAKPIQLAPNNPKGGEVAIVTGWGATDLEKPEVPEVLQVVDVPIVSQKDCSDVYGNIPESMVCAGIMDKGGKDSCYGDSGGPLVVDGALVGIVSWGIECALAKKPGVYTSVPFYLDWIKEIMSSDQ